MKTSEAFRRVKRVIKSRVHSYICWAAIDVLPLADADRVTGVVLRLLNGNSSLETWLYRNLGVDLDTSAYSPNGQARMQVTRLAWLDHLIEHYESLGD